MISTLGLLVSLFAQVCSSSMSRHLLENLTLLTEDYPPYNFVDSQSQVRGIATDILMSAYQHEGIKMPRPVVVPWARLYSQTRKTMNIAGFTMVRTKGREQNFKLVSLGFTTKTSIMTLASERSDSFDISTSTIGVVRKDIGITLLDEFNIQSFRVETSTAKSMLTLLFKGRVDAIAYEERVARFKLKSLFFDNSILIPIQALSRSDGTIAFKKNTSPCITRLLAKSIETVDVDNIVRKYIN